MKTKRFFLFGLLAVLLATSLVLTGCGEDDGDGDGGGGTATLSDYAGTYTGTFSPSATVLTVTANSLSINDSTTTTISSVTTSAGGTFGKGYSWVYLNADGAKIGIATEAGSVNAIYLGTTSTASFADYNNPTPELSDITDGAITGRGWDE
jgi:hypothetical protein